MADFPFFSISPSMLGSVSPRPACLQLTGLPPWMASAPSSHIVPAQEPALSLPLGSCMNISDFIVYFLPSQLNIMSVVSVDGLLILKSAFAALWAHVHVKKTS